MSKESCYNTSTCSPFPSPLLQYRPYLASYDTALRKRKIGIVVTPLFSGSFQIMIDNPHLARVGSESRDVKEKYLQILSSLKVIIFSFHQAGSYTQIFINRFLMQRLSANWPYYREIVPSAKVPCSGFSFYQHCWSHYVKTSSESAFLYR